MQEFVSFLNRFFDSLPYQRRVGILFLFCACGLSFMFPFGELSMMALAFGAASGTCLVSRSTPDRPSSEREADAQEIPARASPEVSANNS